MAEIETSTEYAARLCCHIVDSLTSRQQPYAAKAEALAIIEARDAAVANQAKLELIAEIRGYVAAAYPKSGASHRAYDSLFQFLDSKYAQKGGG